MRGMAWLASVAIVGGAAMAEGATTKASAPARRVCDHPPSPVVRARVIVSPAVSPVEGSAVVRIVEKVWRPEGLSFEWLDRRAAVASVDVFVYVDGPALKDAPRGTLGAVSFVAGQPTKVVRVSVDAIRSWAATRMASIYPISGRRQLALGLDVGRQIVENTLAHVVAHEIGHVLLATRSHGDSGVMAQQFAEVHAMTTEIPLALDRASRERLKSRLAGAATCGN